MATPVVFVHGAWFTPACWDNFRSRLAACGFFWELWNVYAYPKWTYRTPGVAKCGTSQRNCCTNSGV